MSFTFPLFLSVLVPFQFIFLIIILTFVDAQKEQYIQLDLIRHQPCSWRQGWSKWRRKFEFEGGDRFSGAQLKEDQNHPGCYLITGKVTVYEPMSEQVNIYVALSNSANRNIPPESCHGSNPKTGCGGFGSCLYCSACNTFGTGRSVAKAQLTRNGRPIDCTGSLTPGIFNNLSLKFCLPSKRKFLESQGITEEAIEAIFNPNGAEGTSVNSNLGMFASVYIFDRDVRSLVRSQQKLERLIRSMRRIPEHETLDAKTYWSLPFNRLLKDQELFVACHKLYGNVKLV